MDQPLTGIRVADFSQMMQGPWATQKLADMGADVVKIERIGGEWERSLRAGGELDRGISPFFLAMNRNKRSITLDLKSDDGQAIARDIVEDADLLVENFRPGVMETFGLDYETVNSFNPEIIYVACSGFGSSGPYVDRPGQDLLLQSTSGLARNTGRATDPPTPAGSAVVDEHSATLIALHAMFALFYRERTGEGQKVEANLLNAALDFQCQEITAALSMDREFERSDAGVAQPWLGAPYGIFETTDDYVAIAMTPIEEICDVFDIESLRSYTDPESVYEHRDEITRTIEAHTAEYRTDELLNLLLDADVWAAEVNDFHEMATDPQVEHNEALVKIEHPNGGTFTTTGIPVSHSESPGSIDSRPPLPGEHTEEILAELGRTPEEVAALIEEAVVSVPEGP